MSPTMTSNKDPVGFAVEDNTLTPQLKVKVFGNELTRNLIFDYVFSATHNGKLRINKNVLTCRLVDHCWLDYVTGRLQKCGCPNSSLHTPHFTLNFKYSKNRKRSENHKKNIQHFLDTWTATKDASRRIPLFDIWFHKNSIDEFMLQGLVRCLTICGNSLRVLTLNLRSDKPVDDHVNRINFDVDTINQMHLPTLKYLHVLLPLHHVNSPLVTRLLLQILSGCKQPTIFLIEDDSYRRCGVVPWDKLFVQEGCLCGERQILPDSLVAFGIHVFMTSDQLKKLLIDDNSLPNLTSLELFTRVGRDVLCRIIDRFSLQLSCIYLDTWCERNSTIRSLNLVEFPVMPKLKEMSVSCFHSERRAATLQPFPVLETLKLRSQNPTMMQNWTRNVAFTNVNSLEIKFLGLHSHIFTRELSQQLHVAFPNVQKLQIEFYECLLEDGSIQNIFQYMLQLHDLTLRPYYFERKASIWDAILLGVTPEYAENIAGIPREYWNSINLNNQRIPSRSIVNLSRLTSFSLTSYPESPESELDDLIISDVTFHFAFMCMPNLHKLTLNDAFGASAEMAKEWRTLGRSFYGYEATDEYLIVGQEDQDL